MSDQQPTDKMTVATPQGIATTGGQGFGGSRLFKLKPGNLQLVQNMTHQEGAIPGKIRIIETNQHFEEIQVVMLAEPQEPKPRAYRQPGVFSKEGLLCYSLDGIKPADKAVAPQAMQCAGCPKADWSKWRANKIPANLPPCQDYWHVLFAERSTQLPYWFNIKGTSQAPFQDACQNIARTLGLLQAQGQNPNIWDVSFTIYVVKKGPNFLLGFKDFAPVTSDEARAKFGAIFQDYAKRRAEYEQAASESQTAAQNTQIDNAVTGAQPAQQPAQAQQPPVVLPQPPKPPAAAVIPPNGGEEITI